MRERRHLDAILAEQQVPALETVAPLPGGILLLLLQPLMLPLRVAPIRVVVLEQPLIRGRRPRRSPDRADALPQELRA
eukprot:15461772-Alexandrium_andersonii.AAC.1